MYISPSERDRQLWEDLRGGSSESLSELFIHHADELFNYGNLLCGDQQVVEDAIQNLFLRLWQKRAKLSQVDSVKAYLFAALRNGIRDSYRNKKIVPSFSLSVSEDRLPVDPLMTQGSREDEWIREEQRELQRELLQKLLDLLPERMQQAIYLRYSSGLDYEAIAQVMNIQPQTAINMVYRASQKLRKYSALYTERLFFFFLFCILRFYQ